MSNCSSTSLLHMFSFPVPCCSISFMILEWWYDRKNLPTFTLLTLGLSYCGRNSDEQIENSLLLRGNDLSKPNKGWEVGPFLPRTRNAFGILCQCHQLWKCILKIGNFYLLIHRAFGLRSTCSNSYCINCNNDCFRKDMVKHFHN